MPIFDPDQLRTLAASYSALQRRLDSVAEAYAFFPYKTQQGGQYATHGFLRRFNTMHRCIERVFAMLPPEQDERPADPVLLDAAVYIQIVHYERVRRARQPGVDMGQRETASGQQEADRP